MKIFILKLIILTLILPLAVKSQSLKINGYDTKNYPDITVYFTAITAGGKQLTSGDYADEDVWKTENGMDKNGKVVCSPPGVSKFSTILVFDNSWSMNDKSEDGTKTKYDLAKIAAQTWIQSLPDGRFECALMSFSSNVWLIRDFTDNKAELMQATNSDSLKPIAGGGTDYNAAFLWGRSAHPGETTLPEGALLVGRRAKYPLYIIFLTDGGHNFGDPRKNVWVDEINKYAAEVGATIYSVIMLKEQDVAPQDVDNIWAISDYVYFDQTTENVLKNTYKSILESVKKTAPPPPCEFTYQSDCDGGDSVTLHVRNGQIDVEQKGYFKIPDSLKPYLEYDPPLFDAFLNVPGGTKATKTFNITARNNYVDFYGPPDIGDSKFIVSKPASFNNLRLERDKSMQIEVTYDSPPGDSTCYQTYSAFDASMCSSGTFTPEAGWLFVRPVNMGSTVLGNTGTLDYESVFCNHTCQEVNIEDIYLSGGDDSFFKITTSPKPLGTLAPGECINLSFSFKPAENRAYSTKLIVRTDKGDFNNTIDALGSGFPEISATKVLEFKPGVHCNEDIVDSVLIENTGAKDLEITSLNLAYPYTVDPPVGSITLKPGEKKYVYIRFSPGKAGTFSQKLTINSNANQEPAYEVTLDGKKDSIYFEPDVYDVNIGSICPGDEINKTIKLTAPGADAEFFVIAQMSGALDEGNLGNVTRWDMGPGVEENVNLSVINDDDGDYSGKITFTDSCGIVVQEVNVTWKVVTPAIAPVTASFSANVPDTDTQEITLTNTSDTVITIDKTTYRDVEFYTENGSLEPPFDIPAGGSVKIRIVYKPTQAANMTSYLVLSGSPCGFADSVKLLGQATAASVEIHIDNQTGVIGQVIPVPVLLRNGNNFDKSLTKNITTTVSYNNQVLKYLSIVEQGTGIIVSDDNNGNLLLEHIPVQAVNSEQTIVTINFEVLPDPPSNTSPLDLSDSKSEGNGQAFYIEKDGIFTLKEVTATIKVDNLKGLPGQKINVPITITNFDNYDVSVNKNLIISLRFNKTVLDCADGSIQCSDDNNDRIAKITVPLSSVTNNQVVVTKSFLAMLGTEKETALHIDDVQLETGQIQADKQDGAFGLIICDQGGDRLFDPNAGAAAIMPPVPNPASGYAEVNYTTPEKGLTKISVIDVLGSEVMDLNNCVVDPGSHSVSFDASKLPAGLYIIVLQTPTQLVSTRFNVIK